MKQLPQAIVDHPQTDDPFNPEVEAILVLIKTLVGELSQPITVVSGLSELLLSAPSRNGQFERDIMTILKQTNRIKETLGAVDYITDYERVSVSWPRGF